MPALLAHAKRAVFKLGTGLLTSGKAELDAARINGLCQQVGELRKRGLEVIIVSSGAVGLGMGKLGLTKRPTDLPELQACAAIGQALLMDLWRRGFEPLGYTVAQILLTHEDVRARHRHLAVRATLEKLLSLGVIPIINENDTVSAAEIKFGDNDTLSALTASLSKADILVILSTIKGLLNLEEGGTLIPFVETITPEIEALAQGTNSPTAVGGMKSKIAAAKIATRSGCGVFIASGQNPTILVDLFSGNAEGTFFSPARLPLHAKKRWMAFFGKPQGNVYIDSGALNALETKGSSLLARGITRCEGEFAEGDLLGIIRPDGSVFARGISRYSNKDLLRIIGKTSEEIRTDFPEKKHLEVIHRDSMVVVS